MTHKKVLFGSAAREKVVQGAEATSDYDREKLEERLAKLSGGVAVIRVGAPSEAEMKSRKEALEGKGNTGFDGARNEYVDLVEAGIIDPTKVVRIALENAVSIASVLLLTEATMTDIPEPEKGGMGRSPEI